ncbi:MAG: PKD domain-containing protein [Oceanipulchritudo sp.]
MRPLILAALVSPLCLSATVVQENWDYPGIAGGTQIAAGLGFNGGSNWSGSEWARENVAPTYQTDVDLALDGSVRGWVDENGAPSGAIASPTGNANGSHVNQAFRQIAPAELTGTTYLGFLFAGGGYGIVSTCAVFFDGDADIPRGMMGLSFMQEATFSYTATTTESVRNSTGTKGTFGRIKYSPVGGTPVPNLVIAKFETDYNEAGHDRVTCILNPTDVRSEALALFTAGIVSNAGVLVHDPGTDLWGSGINPELAISMRGATAGTIDPIVDQIRIAHGGSGWDALVAPSGAPAPAPTAGGSQYLDTTPYAVALDRGGQDPIANGILFLNETDTGAPIVIDGSTPDHGLFFKESKVQLAYLTTGEYSGFAADVWRVSATPGFQVVGDGEVLFDLAQMPVGEVRRVVVDISGVELLEIVVTDGGDGITNDKAALGNPRLIQMPVVELSAWEAWRHEHFRDTLNQPDTVSGPVAMSRGLPNVIRYALGLAPEEDAADHGPSLVDGNLRMRVPADIDADGALARTVEASGNLVDWIPLDPPAPVDENGRPVFHYIDPVAVGVDNPRFMRFAATLSRPTARLTASPLTGTAPLTVQFDGTPSTAGEGGIFRYTWNFGDGDSEALDPSPQHTYQLPGVYEVTLEAYDEFDNAGVARMRITVLSPDNQPPTAAIDASALLVAPGGSVDFDALGSSDFDGDIVSYEWSYDDGTSATGPTVSKTFPSVGFVTATLTVTDDDGATGTASVRVRIDPGDNSTIFPIREGSRILFIGNSLIGFYGPLRDALDNAVNHNPGFDITTGSAGKGAGTLIEYATWPSLTVEAIINQSWDIVIIQPWKEVLEADLTVYEAAADTLIGWVRASGAEPIFYIPHMDWQYWPTYQPTMQNIVSATATRLGVETIDVTPAWNQVLADYPMSVDASKRLVDTASTNEFKDLLYSDNLHQNADGMALNVYLVYKYLTGLSPVGLNPTWPGGMSGYTPALQAYLQGVADQHGVVAPFISATPSHEASF